MRIDVLLLSRGYLFHDAGPIPTPSPRPDININKYIPLYNVVAALYEKSEIAICNI